MNAANDNPKTTSPKTTSPETTAAGASPLPAIGVVLSPSFERRGECFADARAYEAAGCDSLWLTGSEEPWLAAAALAVVTTRVRIVVPLAGEDLGTTAFTLRMATLQRLLPGRLAVRCETAGLVSAARTAVGCPVYGPAGEPAAGSAAGADAVVLAAEDAMRSAGLGPTWLVCGPLRDRAAWRELRERWRRDHVAGVVGFVFVETPRLLDLLRNPDRDDDRSDLALAHG